LLARPLGLRVPGTLFQRAAQARLVVLDLDQQMVAGGDHALEGFF
jgi:hypothetical protein